MNGTKHTHPPNIPSKIRRPPTILPPPIADPDDPFAVERSHLMKMELGKSSSSCKVSLIVRLHRTTALQEFWCASFEEACVYENLAAHPDVISFAEQLTRVDFLNDAGDQTHSEDDAPKPKPARAKRAQKSGSKAPPQQSQPKPAVAWKRPTQIKDLE